MLGDGNAKKQMKSRHKMILVILVGCVAAAAIFHERVAIGATVITNRFSKKSVTDRLNEFGAAARRRIQNDFSKAGVAYPSARATLLVLKAERRLEVYATAGNGVRFIRAYPILAASGGPGPKLREG